MGNDVITLGKLVTIINDVKRGLDPETLATWYRVIENEARERCPPELKNTISITQDPVLWMKFEVKVSKRVIHHLIDTIESKLNDMPFATRLYFQKLEEIILDDAKRKYNFHLDYAS